MPAREEEVHHAEEEGIEFHMLTNPIRIIAGEDYRWVKAIECVKMQLGEPDESGRRRPVVIPDSNFIMDVDTVILAIGQRPNPIFRPLRRDLICRNVVRLWSISNVRRVVREFLRAAIFREVVRQ